MNPWQKIIVFVVAIAGVVVPYAMKSPEAAAAAAAVNALLPSLLRTLTGGAE